jgi:hypothetical protein
MKKIIALLVIFFCGFTHANDGIIDLESINCPHGLKQQPNGGPFSLFIFCDDALGTNIGLINTSRSSGPGAIDLGPSNTMKHWFVTDRFWQADDWSGDVNSYYWSKDLKYLYVATSYIYGTGNLYKLDLLEKTATILVPDNSIKLQPKYAHETRILSVDNDGTLTVKLSFYNPEKNSEDAKLFKVK